jgi:hypothetical protein
MRPHYCVSCKLVFTVFYVYLYLLCFVLFVLCFLYCFAYVYLFSLVVSVLVQGLLPPSDNSIQLVVVVVVVVVVAAVIIIIRINTTGCHTLRHLFNPNVIIAVACTLSQDYSKYSAFGKSLCTCARCWKWCPRASIQAWTRWILFTNTFCRSAFGKSLCIYKSCWKCCPRASIQAWTRTVP